MVCAGSLAVIVSLYRYRYFEGRVPVIKQKLLLDVKNHQDSIGLILGSSHSFYGINASMLDGRWMNMASVSQGFQEDHTILLRAVHEKLPVSRVILPVSYFSNGYALSDSPLPGERNRCLDYSLAYGVNYPFLGIPTWYAHYVGLIKGLFGRDKGHQFDFSGNLVETCSSTDTMINNALQAYQEHASSSDFTNINTYLDSIISICTQKNIRVYLLVMPFSRSYLELMETRHFNTYLTQIKQRYVSAPMCLIDERSLFVQKNPSRFFRDADHLSPCGRDTFSVLLNIQIRSDTFHKP